MTELTARRVLCKEPGKTDQTLFLTLTIGKESNLLKYTSMAREASRLSEEVDGICTPSLPVCFIE